KSRASRASSLVTRSSFHFCAVQWKRSVARCLTRGKWRTSRNSMRPSVARSLCTNSYTRLIRSTSTTATGLSLTTTCSCHFRRKAGAWPSTTRASTALASTTAAKCALASLIPSDGHLRQVDDDGGALAAVPIDGEPVLLREVVHDLTDLERRELGTHVHGVL